VPIFQSEILILLEIPYFGDLVVEPSFFTPDWRGIDELCAQADDAMALAAERF
jgi:hypothetical protein